MITWRVILWTVSRYMYLCNYMPNYRLKQHWRQSHGYSMRNNIHDSVIADMDYEWRYISKIVPCWRYTIDQERNVRYYSRNAMLTIVRFYGKQTMLIVQNNHISTHWKYTCNYVAKYVHVAMHICSNGKKTIVIVQNNLISTYGKYTCN